jgi:hypothetical protein
MPDSHYSTSEIHTASKLREKIQHLFELQQTALSRAIYLGLTPAEGKELDTRRELIKQLTGQLAKLDNNDGAR